MATDDGENDDYQKKLFSPIIHHHDHRHHPSPPAAATNRPKPRSLPKILEEALRTVPKYSPNKDARELLMQGVPKDSDVGDMPGRSID